MALALLAVPGGTRGPEGLYPAHLLHLLLDQGDPQIVPSTGGLGQLPLQGPAFKAPWKPPLVQNVAAWATLSGTTARQPHFPGFWLASECCSPLLRPLLGWARFPEGPLVSEGQSPQTSGVLVSPAVKAVSRPESSGAGWSLNCTQINKNGRC